MSTAAVPPHVRADRPTTVVGTAAFVFAAAVLVGAVAPSLAPSGTPTPTLFGTWSEAGSIFTNNARVVAVPLLLVLMRWNLGRTRYVGDVVVGLLVLGNTAHVGLALGRHQDALLPYLPHLPAELGALVVGGVVWVRSRDVRTPPRQLVRPALLALVLLVAAALLETFAVPHAA